MELQIRLHKQGRVLADGQDEVLSALIERIGLSPSHTREVRYMAETGQVNLATALTISNELQRYRAAVTMNFDPEHMLTFVLGASEAL